MKGRILASTLAAVAALAFAASASSGEVTKYVRYDHGGAVWYGVLEGKTIHQLRGDVFQSPTRTGVTVALGDVTLLAPSEPEKVVAVGLNYRSHFDQAADLKPQDYPSVFDKHATSVIGHQAEITYYEDASDLHFEAEMVLIVGKLASNVSVDEAPDHIFAVAAGNDVSERVWQQSDLQWFRAKGADTFGPVGPVMARGVDYNDLLLQSRLNGKVMQSQRTSDPGVRLRGPGQLHQPLRDAETGRHDLHRHPRVDGSHAARRCHRDRTRERGDTAQHHR